MWFYSVIFICELIIVCSKSINSSESKSTYAKVTRWGAGQATPRTRENNGQMSWFQRSNANKQSGSNSKTNEKGNNVAYYYSMKVPSSKLDDSINMEEIPGLGEVQERFIPRPYFDAASNLGESKPSVIYGTPIPPPDTLSVNLNNSFTTYSLNNPKIPSNLYDSPFTSYNPPKLKSPIKETPAYPPSNAAIIVNPSFNSSNYFSSTQSNSESVNKSPIKAIDAPYYPSNPASMHGMNIGDISVKFPPDSVDYENDPAAHSDDNKDESKFQFQEDQYLSVPPEDFHGKIPQYIEYDPHKPHTYDDPHYSDHHVHYEVKTTTTTTTPEPPQERDGHYSYYYLGRKLWYIPLYFSVYFICYVTILILKSIARHKIRFSHHFDKENRRSSSGRGMDHVDQIYQKVATGIENVKHKYM